MMLPNDVNGCVVGYLLLLVEARDDDDAVMFDFVGAMILCGYRPAKIETFSVPRVSVQAMCIRNPRVCMFGYFPTSLRR